MLPDTRRVCPQSGKSTRSGNLAAALRRHECFEEALACVDVVLARGSTNVIATINRANILFDPECFGEVRPAYQRGLSRTS